MKIIIALAVIALPLSAQDLRTATLVGTVSDPSGATIASASVTVTNVNTNVVSKSKSNNEGAYYIPFLIPGQLQA